MKSREIVTESDVIYLHSTRGKGIYFPGSQIFRLLNLHIFVRDFSYPRTPTEKCLFVFLPLLS